ncbi:hypothetical protein D3C76_1128660 [compost metagenome]
MAAGLGADGGEGFHLRAVLLHVLATSAAEEHQRARHAGAFRESFGSGAIGFAHGLFAIGPDALQRAWLHLFETEGQGAIDSAAFHGLARQEQRGGAAGAVVVDVDHRDTGHAHFIQGGLAAGGIAIDVAGIGLLDQLEVQAGILQRQAHGLGAHLDIGLAGAGLGERDHANANDIGFLRHLLLHAQLTVSRTAVDPGFLMAQWLRKRSGLYPAHGEWHGVGFGGPLLHWRNRGHGPLLREHLEVAFL